MMPDAQTVIQAAATVLGIPAISNGVGKLLETVSHQIDLAAEPYHIRKMAAAEADAKAIKVIGDERAKLLKAELKGIAGGEYARAIELAILQADRRLQCISSVIVGAAGFVPDTVSDKPVDQDWLTQFLVHCQDVSNAEMQSIWSQLLAGEVAMPGSFSLRTMAAVKLLSREDAHLFTRLCKSVWTEVGDRIERHVLLPFTTTNSKDSGLTFGELTHLESVGLVRLVHQGCFHLLIEDSIIVRYGESSYSIKRDPSYFSRKARPVLPNNVDHAHVFEMGPVSLTDIGSQLAPIAGAEISKDHCDWVRTRYQRQHWTFTPV